jgi:hypothetical protein
MSSQNPHSTLPLFASSVHAVRTTRKPAWKAGPDVPIPSDRAVDLSPSEQGPRERLTPQQLGIAGQEDAAHHLPESVRKSVLEAIRGMAGPFTTDTLRGKLSQSVRDVLALHEHRNGLQGVLTGEAKTGAVRHTGEYVRSSRPSARGRMLKVWERV